MVEPTVEAWASAYVASTALDYKLAPPPTPSTWEPGARPRRLEAPGRPAAFELVAKSPRVPRDVSDPHRRAELVHAFFHHELQAAELMCWALCAFPDTPRAFRRGLVAIFWDEVRHMQAYVAYLEALGHRPGDFPMRDWFWERVPRCADAAAFTATLGIGFEGGNLDHAERFAARLAAAGDRVGSELCARVGREEEAHVRFAWHWLARLAGDGREVTFDDWRRHLPAPLSPILMRGRPLNREARLRSGQTPEFIAALGRFAERDREPSDGGGGRHAAGWRSADAAGSRPQPAPAGAPAIAWWLNFDADLEFEHGAGYTPSAALRARAAALEVPALLGAGDIVLGRDACEAGRPYAALAFSPTPRAIAAIAAAGLSPPPAPPLAVLRAVNHRAFCAALGQTLDGGSFARTAAECERALSQASGELLLKRPFGFAGRGRRAVRAAERSADDRRWIEASLRKGEGLQIEPRVERDADFALHGYVVAGGGVVLGAPTAQRIAATGEWLGTRRAGDGELSPDERRALVEHAELCAAALARAGYFGPFGLDAFRYRSAPGGALRFNPRCELNARYTMGWAVGMGDARPDRAALTTTA